MVWAAQVIISTLLAVVVPQAACTDVTPLNKVIQMLEGMSSKGKAEKHNEAVEFAKFQQWCSSSREDLTKNIDQAAAKIEQLEADLEKAESDAEVLGEEIGELQANIAELEGEAKNASVVRAKEKADYSDEHKDLSESIDAIIGALEVLTQRMADVPQSLAQVQNSPHVPANTKAVIASFLGLASSSESAEGSPEANAYEFQSNSVVDLLENLKRKFKEQRLALEKAEINAKNNYELLMQKLTDDLKVDKQSEAEKTATKSGRLEDAAIAKGDLEITKKGKTEDEKTLSEATVECHEKSVEFEKNQVLRAEEIKAIHTAVDILRSNTVSGVADQYLPTLAQQSSFAQLRSQTTEDPMTRRRLVEFLQSRAQKSGSKYLSLVASRAAADPFGKVKTMIKALIVKLMEEANEEADNKAYCDAELGTNKLTRENKAAEVESLTAAVEEHEAKSVQLASELKELADAIAELLAQQADATKMRDEEKASNAKVVADAKAAQEAVETATQVLKDFYAKANEAALVQENSGLGQEMEDATQSPYQGMQVAGGNILDFLEVVLSDFARLESETYAAEDAAQAEYEEYFIESSKDIAVKKTEVSHKEGSKQECDETLLGLKKELELTQKELDAAMEYYEKLKPTCVDNGLSYDERVAARKEEIESLMEAMKILNQQDLA